MYKHLLLTRFNTNSIKNAAGDVFLNDAWLSNRLILFESLTLQSVANQSNLNFEWLIQHDIRTPDNFRNSLKVACDKFPNLHIKFLYFEDIKAGIQLEEYIRNNYLNYPHLITSRLDSDDLIHKDYIQTIQNKFEEDKSKIIFAKSGYRYSFKKKLFPIKRLDNQENGAFQTLISPNSKDHLSVFSRRHDAWKNHPNRESISNKPFWIQTIHSNNVINKFFGKLTFQSRTALHKNFGLNPTL